MSYFDKYMKYKSKYMKQKMVGGSVFTFNVNNTPIKIISDLKSILKYIK
jgi:hypothetical protein